MSMIKTRQRVSGYLMFLVLIMILIIGFMGSAIVEMFFGNALGVALNANSAQALYLAESGIEHATHKLLEPVNATASNRIACASLNTNSISNSITGGQYSVGLQSSNTSYQFVSSPTTVTDNPLSATNTTINVGSNSNYSATGKLSIDNETLNYTGKSGTTAFTGVTRGADSTIATTHAQGTTIGQYQCNIVSTGLVNTGAASIAQRVVQDTVQLPFGVVAANSATNYTFGQWNYPTELAWNNVSTSTANYSNLYTPKVISYTDAWIVGDTATSTNPSHNSTATILHWNGATWTRIFPATDIAYALYWIDCISKSECYAVGAATGTGPLILQWSGGTTWARNTSFTTNVALIGVDCPASGSCWAVGPNSNNRPLILQYTSANNTWARITLATNTAGLNAISCYGSGDCWAVGTVSGNNPLIMRLVNTTWSTITNSLGGALNSISCPLTTDCWAVGNVLTNTTYIARYTGGSWSRFAAPAPASNLNAVKCVSNTDCWAVGQTSTGNTEVFFHWDGTSWTNFTNTTSTFTAGNTFQGIDFISPLTRPTAGWKENYA